MMLKARSSPYFLMTLIKIKIPLILQNSLSNMRDINPLNASIRVILSAPVKYSVNEQGECEVQVCH